MGIRSKILAGVIVIGAMLFFSGAIAIYELNVLGKSMQSLVDVNIRSINASRNMLKASSEIDLGILNVISGNWNRGKSLVKTGLQTYDTSIKLVSDNMGTDEEKVVIQRVYSNYAKYKSLTDTLFAAKIPKNMDWYYNTFLPVQKSLTDEIGKVIDLNQGALYNSTAVMKVGAYRAFVPGVITIIAGLIFVVLFYSFLIHYFIDPLLRITHGVENFVKHAMPFRVKIETKDEIGQLGKSIEKLIQMDRNNKIVD